MRASILSVRTGFATALLALILALPGCTAPPRSENAPPTVHPGLSIDDTGRAWVQRTLDSLDLEARVAQMLSVRVFGTFVPEPGRDRATTIRLVRDLGVGGVVFFQGTPVEQAALVNEFQSAAIVPLLVGQDMEFGAGMRLDGATRFPVAMAIAATGDPDLAYRVGLTTAREARAVGVTHVYAPVLDVNTNPANPVIDTRAFADRADRVSRFATPLVRGLQDGGVHATAKHFPGHGSTDRDSHEALPVTRLSASELFSVHLAPYRSAIEAGLSTIMTAHVAYPQVDSGRTRAATLAPGFTEILIRDSLRFDGLVVTDALTMQAVSRNTDPAEVAVSAVETGADMLLLSADPELAHRAVVRAVREGRIGKERIERSVRRILTAKAMAGLHRQPMTDLEQVRHAVGGGRARALADRVAERALTLLSGDLPNLGGTDGKRVLVVTVNDGASVDADLAFREALRQELPSVVLEHVAVTPGSIEQTRTLVARRAAGADHVLVSAFAFAGRWKKQPATAAALARVIDGLAAGERAATLVVFGTPYMLASLSRLPDRVLMAYDGSDAVQRAAARALVGSVSITGRLPVDIPGAFRYGDGLTVASRLPNRGVPEAAGLDATVLAELDGVVRDAIARDAFPGAAVAVGRGNTIAYLEGHGFYTYESPRRVTPGSLFDLASLTKVVATTTAMMLLYEDGLVDLDAPVAQYVPEFGRSGKDSVTVRHLLSHTGGLIPFRPFHRMGIVTRRGVLEAIYSDSLQYEPGTESRYSDFGPIMLAELVERVTGRRFSEFVRTEVFEPLGMYDTGYRRSGSYDAGAVPTEVDDYFRNRTLQGEVHDETAWILGGTAGHAGLFSTARDLARFAGMLASGGRIGNHEFLHPETVRLFTTRVDSTGRHTRALGWDTRSPEGRYSSAGHLFGPRSFGHTGFTGTSMWIDPDAGLYVVLLANRVYPTRDNSLHVAVRPAVADRAFSSVRTERFLPLFPSLAD